MEGAFTFQWGVGGGGGGGSRGGGWGLVSSWAASLLSEKAPYGEDISFDAGGYGGRGGGSKKIMRWWGTLSPPLPPCTLRETLRSWENEARLH